MNIVGIDRYRYKTFINNIKLHLDEIIQKAQKIKEDIANNQYALNEADMKVLEEESEEVFTAASKEMFLINSLASFFVHMSREIYQWSFLSYDNLSNLMTETNQEICHTITLLIQEEDFFPDKILS